MTNASTRPRVCLCVYPDNSRTKFGGVDTDISSYRARRARKNKIKIVTDKIARVRHLLLYCFPSILVRFVLRLFSSSSPPRYVCLLVGRYDQQSS